MIGEELGPYRIVREIARGGMGVVWLARHIELGSDVAIKVLLAQSTRDSESVQRFFNEARAAARVKGPGIVQVLAVGRTAEGAPYLAMELLEGTTLRKRLRERGPMSLEDAATVIRQVATTLAAAHAAGIVHRDLKPDNIMLVPDPEVPGGERAKVLDFGIAKLASSAAPGVETRAGTLLGTPHYMSPEQCRGSGDVDARSDVYSLGCILFEMVCGQPPFQGEAIGELIGKHQFVAPPTPSSLHPEVPPWLETVILRSLAKDPADRYPSMQELADALEAGGARAASVPIMTPRDLSGAEGLAATARTPPGTAPTLAGHGPATTPRAPKPVPRPGPTASEPAPTAPASRRTTTIAFGVIALVAVAAAVALALTRTKGSTSHAAAPVDAGALALTHAPDAGRAPAAPAPAPDAAPRAIAIDAGVRHAAPPAPPHPRPHPAATVVASSAGRRTYADGGVESDDAMFERLIDEGAVAFDKGDYRGAMAKNLAALKLAPNEPQAMMPLTVDCCALHDRACALRYFSKLSDDRQAWLTDRCSQLGVTVP